MAHVMNVSINTTPSGDNVLVNLVEQYAGATNTLQVVMPEALYQQALKTAETIAASTPLTGAQPFTDPAGAIKQAVLASVIKAHASEVPVDLTPGGATYEALKHAAAKSHALGYAEMVKEFKSVIKGSQHCATPAHVNITATHHTHDAPVVTTTAPTTGHQPHHDQVNVTAAPSDIAAVASAPSTTGEVTFNQPTVSAAPTTSADTINVSAPVVDVPSHTQVTLPNSEVAGAGINSATTTGEPQGQNGFSAPTTTGAPNVQYNVVGPHTAAHAAQNGQSTTYTMPAHTGGHPQHPHMRPPHQQGAGGYAMNITTPPVQGHFTGNAVASSYAANTAERRL